MAAPFPTEEIPDSDRLFMRVHRRFFDPDGILNTACFRNQPDDTTGAMSTDWDKYASPQATRDRGRTPSDNAVIAFIVRDVRSIPKQGVVHTPQLDHQAHTDVTGSKKADPQVRVLLGRYAEIVIPLT